MAGGAAVARGGAAGLTAQSQLQEGKIAEAQGKLAKQIAVRNQRSLERQRIAELEASAIESSRIARKEKIAKARQRAIAGKTGVGVRGATLSVLADAASQFSLDRNLALRRGLLRGRELRERGQIELAKGRFAFTLGRRAAKLSFVRAGATILGSAGGS
jgi:hypothetical protein